MAMLVVIAYPDQGTAEEARKTVQRAKFTAADRFAPASRDTLEAQFITADQFASVSRDTEGRYHVHTTHSVGQTAGGAVAGGLWGLLFGTIFLIPIAGLAVGAGLGATLFGHRSAKGIDKSFQEQVRDYVKPGTSALFMVIERGTPDEAILAVQQYGGTIIETSLSDEDAKRLGDAIRAG